MVPAALLAAQRSGLMPAGVTPGAVVVVAAAEPPAAVVAVVVAGATVVPVSPDVVLSLPQAATSSRATTPAAGRRRRGRFVIGPPGSHGTSWARRVLRAVPAQHDPLEHADHEDAGGAHEGEHEDRAPQLQRQVEGLRLLDRITETAGDAGEELGEDGPDEGEPDGDASRREQVRKGMRYT